MPDPIIRELWRVKDELAKQFGYDLRTLVDELRKRQASSSRQVVDLSARRKRQPPQPGTN